MLVNAAVLSPCQPGAADTAAHGHTSTDKRCAISAAGAPVFGGHSVSWPFSAPSVQRRGMLLTLP